MRWLARRPSAKACPPQADLTGLDAGDADEPLPGADELLAAAERFLALFHDENPEAGAFADRMRRVRAEVQTQGTYRHTPEELAFAARAAWRNSSRCIGRPVLAHAARQGPAAGDRRGPDRGRMRHSSAAGHQCRADPADDHRLRARCPRAAGPAHPQFAADRLRRPSARRRPGRVSRAPGDHPAGSRARLAARRSARPVRPAAADHPAARIAACLVRAAQRRRARGPAAPS